MYSVVKQIKRSFTVFTALFITGSKCYSIFTYRGLDWEKKSRSFFLPKSFSTPATRHGIKYEDEALNCYREETALVVAEMGFVICKKYPWLGFSPDGIVLENGIPIKLVEIKCPLAVITPRVRAFNFKTCGSEELAQCARHISVLTDTGLTFVKSKEDLDLACPDLNQSLSCIHAYSRLCMNFKQRKHFRKLFHGTGAMILDLCRNGTYQDEFLAHAPCMQKVSTETEVCFSKYSKAMDQIQTTTNKQKEIEEAAHRNNHNHHYPHHHNKSDETVFRYQKAKREAADEGLKSVCCSFQEYVDCSTQTVRKTCGDDAAQFSRGFLDKMASSMIKMHCMDFSADDCRERGFHIEGFHPEGFYYSNSPQVSSQITALSIVTLVAFLLR